MGSRTARRKCLSDPGTILFVIAGIVSNSEQTSAPDFRTLVLQAPRDARTEGILPLHGPVLRFEMWP